MILLADIKPLFYINLLFGNPPHVISNDNFALTKLGSIYSVAWCFVFLYLGYSKFQEIFADLIKIKLFILKLSRSTLLSACLYTDVAIGYYSHKKLCSVIDNLRSYDAATKIEPIGNRWIRCMMWIFVTVRVIYWTFMGYIFFLYGDDKTAKTGFYVILYACVFSQFDKFTGIMLLLYARFRHLNELLLTNDIRVNVHVRSGRGLHLQDVWWLHGCLMDAAEILNSIYSIQLLLWIASMSFIVTYRIYTISETWPEVHVFVLKDLLLAVSSLMVLVTVVTICHMTADQANKVGPTIFSSQLPLSRKSGLHAEYIEVGMYFQMRQLEFSAAGGFIRIDLPLLLSISAAMTTYLVILHASKKT